MRPQFCQLVNQHRSSKTKRKRQATRAPPFGKRRGPKPRQVAEGRARALLVPEMAPPRDQAANAAAKSRAQGARSGARSVRSARRQAGRRRDRGANVQSRRRRRSPKSKREALWCAGFVGSRGRRVLQVRKPSGSREGGVPQGLAAPRDPPFARTAEPKGAPDRPAFAPSGLMRREECKTRACRRAESGRGRRGPSGKRKRRGPRRLENGGARCRARSPKVEREALWCPR